MSKFIQLHFLTSYPPANLNRDDMGRPKTAKMGGVDRLRVSSQSLKRAWRTSDLFKSAMDGHIGSRTKELGRKLYDRMIKEGLKDKTAREWAKAIAGSFGKLKAEDKKNPEKLIDLEIEQLSHISPEELEAVDSLVTTLVKEKRAPNDEELALLRHPETAVDIALFGRMLTKNTRDESTVDFGVDAACQVSHAISVHPVVIEDDYFTAVDDLNDGKEDMGAAHIGETGFASALFYTYVCIDIELLLKNLGDDKALANKAVAALIEAAVKVAPEGKQNSFASRAYASYVLVEKGEIQPRSLSVAFLKPVKGDNYEEDAVKALEKTCEYMDKVYEITGLERKKLNAFTGEGKLSELVKFVQE
jgi:CRISPR system Cascade subunit CasC